MFDDEEMEEEEELMDVSSQSSDGVERRTGVAGVVDGGRATGVTRLLDILDWTRGPGVPLSWR